MKSENICDMYICCHILSCKLLTLFFLLSLFFSFLLLLYLLFVILHSADIRAQVQEIRSIYNVRCESQQVGISFLYI